MLHFYRWKLVFPNPFGLWSPVREPKMYHLWRYYVTKNIVNKADTSDRQCAGFLGIFTVSAKDVHGVQERCFECLWLVNPFKWCNMYLQPIVTSYRSFNPRVASPSNFRLFSYEHDSPIYIRKVSQNKYNCVKTQVFISLLRPLRFTPLGGFLTPTFRTTVKLPISKRYKVV